MIEEREGYKKIDFMGFEFLVREESVRMIQSSLDNVILLGSLLDYKLEEYKYEHYIVVDCYMIKNNRHYLIFNLFISKDNLTNKFYDAGMEYNVGFARNEIMNSRETCLEDILEKAVKLMN